MDATQFDVFFINIVNLARTSKTDSSMKVVEEALLTAMSELW